MRAGSRRRRWSWLVLRRCGAMQRSHTSTFGSTTTVTGRRAQSTPLPPPGDLPHAPAPGDHAAHQPRGGLGASCTSSRRSIPDERQSAAPLTCYASFDRHGSRRRAGLWSARSRTSAGASIASNADSTYRGPGARRAVRGVPERRRRAPGAERYRAVAPLHLAGSRAALPPLGAYSRSSARRSTVRNRPLSTPWRDKCAAVKA